MRLFRFCVQSFGAMVFRRYLRPALFPGPQWLVSRLFLACERSFLARLCPQTRADSLSGSCGTTCSRVFLPAWTSVRDGTHHVFSVKSALLTNLSSSRMGTVEGFHSYEYHRSDIRAMGIPCLSAAAEGMERRRAAITGYAGPRVMRRHEVRPRNKDPHELPTEQRTESKYSSRSGPRSRGPSGLPFQTPTAGGQRP